MKLFKENKYGCSDCNGFWTGRDPHCHHCGINTEPLKFNQSYIALVLVMFLSPVPANSMIFQTKFVTGEVVHLIEINYKGEALKDCTAYIYDVKMKKVENKMETNYYAEVSCPDKEKFQSILKDSNIEKSVLKNKTRI